ncbi:MAG: hypothetical protein J1F23_06740 [Oscillospiraceae bacterium]|nr:hypothetical protein [Oscillospiraceae bacterium]
MESFKFWILSVSGAMAITAVFKILLSNSSISKMLNIFFSLFVLFYTVIPLQNVFSKEKIDFNLHDETAYEEYYEDGYKRLVENSIKNICEKMSVRVLSVDMSSYIDSEGYLNIRSLDVKTDSPEKSDEIERELKTQLGFEVNIY